MEVVFSSNSFLSVASRVALHNKNTRGYAKTRVHTCQRMNGVRELHTCQRINVRAKAYGLVLFSTTPYDHLVLWYKSEVVLYSGVFLDKEGRYNKRQR